MVVFQFNGKDIYIDGRLKEQLDKHIVPELKKKDKDAVFIVDGGERKGKSVFGMGIGAYIASQLGTELNLSNICMTPVEFREKIINADKNEVVIYDEAHRGMASARALSEVNAILKDLMMEMGQKNLFVFIILPTFFLLDRYAALFRSRGLFHIYERKHQRGFWVFYNEKNKLKLYMKGRKEFNYNIMRFPPFRGRFYNQYAVDEDEYREKKAKSFKSSEKNTKSERWTSQRNSLIWILFHDFKMKQGLIAKSMNPPISKRDVEEVVRSEKQRLGFLTPKTGVNRG